MAKSARPAIDSSTLETGLQSIRAELRLPERFPADVQQAAERAAQSPRLPDLDRTDLEFVTIDPPGARDLDQALHIERSRGGFTVHYAIADVGAFVTPGDSVDQEAHARGETIYGAGSKIPLHPPALSEGAASLLPDQVRPALLWTVEVDTEGEGTDVRVERALVRSRAQLHYAGAQALIDSNAAPESLLLLREVGLLREEKERARGGVSLPLPDQELVPVDGGWDLVYRTIAPVENWNAQISLLTGLGAAWLMLRGGVGLLRVLPPAADRDLARLRRTARALDIAWPSDQGYADFVRGLDPAYAEQAAMITACTRLLRGSGYVGFVGTPPDQPRHSALAAPYAHVTAPLRRLVDRCAGEICVAISAGRPVPAWVLAELPGLPEVMRESGRRANAYERAVIDLVEAEVLRDRIGQEFAAVVLAVEDRDERRGTVMVRDPAIEAPVVGTAALPLGADVVVRLSRADLEARRVGFELVSVSAGSSAEAMPGAR